MPDSGPTDVHPPPLRNQLTVQDMTAAGDEVWAVGRATFPGPTLIAHSAGGEPWQLTSYSTSPEAMFTDLAGVHATSSADVWGVGSDGVLPRTHIAHSDGTTWHPVESPGDADGSHMSAVAARGRDDGFAVGSRRPQPAGPMSPALPPLAAWDTLAVRWDGTQWTAVPGPGSGHGILSSVCAVGSGAYWAAGTTALSTRSGNFALLARYADERWQEADVEVAGALHAVAAVGPDDIWAVGQDQDPNHPPQPLILHYDGHDWTPVSPPAIPGQSWLNGVACAGRDNVWVVGVQDHDGAQIGPLIMHFDGSSWAVIDPPATAAPAVLQAVVVLPGGDAYAAGIASSVSADSGYTIPLVTHP